MAQMGEWTTMAAGLIVASVKGHAAKEEDAKKQLMKPEQLPITTKPPLRSRYAEEQPGCLPRGVSVFVKNRSTGAVQFGKGGCVYAKNPPGNVLPKMGGISASALVGFVSARRGSRFRKIASATPRPGTGHFRSNGLLSCCCPVQLVITAKVTGKKAYATSQQIYEAVKSLWTKQQQQRVISDPKEKTKLGSSAETEILAKIAQNLKPGSAFADRTQLCNEDQNRIHRRCYSFSLTPSSWITASPRCRYVQP
uniref:MICOS complex subunit n=1 Tax=Sus scrofa TaxID=9823 RepID=A0A4X1SK44_PIG